VLNLSGLSAWIDHYPPDNLEREIDFAEVAALQLALEEVYGVRAGRNMERRSAWTGFQGPLTRLGALDALRALAQQQQPPLERVAIAVASFAKALSQSSDQVCQAGPAPTGVQMVSRPCPHCWGRQTTEPVCHAMVGALEDLCSLVTGGQAWSVTEVTCSAAGADECRFLIQPTSPG
jgi:predicted hydrocarbon binding protein